jgi:hypothetical protein
MNAVVWARPRCPPHSPHSSNYNSYYHTGLRTGGSAIPVQEGANSEDLIARYLDLTHFIMTYENIEFEIQSHLRYNLGVGSGDTRGDVNGVNNCARSNRTESELEECYPYRLGER